MHLTAREQEKLLIVVAADLARRRKERGVKLNHPGLYHRRAARGHSRWQDGR